MRRRYESRVAIDSLDERAQRMGREITEADVRSFLLEYERAQSSGDFDLVAPLVDPNAVFRFNDGDYRGLREIRGAFEATWALDVDDESYTVHDVKVELVRTGISVATFAWTWSGTSPDGPFQIEGRGTTVLAADDGTLRIVVEHLSR